MERFPLSNTHLRRYSDGTIAIEIDPEEIVELTDLTLPADDEEPEDMADEQVEDDEEEEAVASHEEEEEHDEDDDEDDVDARRRRMIAEARKRLSAGKSKRSKGRKERKVPNFKEMTTECLVEDYSTDAWALITEDKPTDNEIESLKDAGFTWNGSLKVWFVAKSRYSEDDMEKMFGAEAMIG